MDARLRLARRGVSSERRLLNDLVALACLEQVELSLIKQEYYDLNFDFEQPLS